MYRLCAIFPAIPLLLDRLDCNGLCRRLQLALQAWLLRLHGLCEFLLLLPPPSLQGRQGVGWSGDGLSDTRRNDCQLMSMVLDWLRGGQRLDGVRTPGCGW